MKKKSIIIISGPTGIGKSKLAVDLASSEGEIISADSMQVYKYLDIGTAKPEEHLTQKVKHHLISIIDPHQDYSAYQFEQDADKIIDEILSRHRIPLIVGGTGLYIRALIYGLSKAPGKDPDVRHSLNDQLEKKGINFLFQQLKKVDPEYASLINAKDTTRIIRALEVYQISKQPFSYYMKEHKKEKKYNILWIGLERPREELYRLINDRTKHMYQAGLIDETKQLIQKGFQKFLEQKKAIGYLETIDYINNMITLEQAITLTCQKTRQYAKRQMTWFRKEKEIQWFHPDEFVKMKQALDLYWESR